MHKVLKTLSKHMVEQEQKLNKKVEVWVKQELKESNNTLECITQELFLISIILRKDLVKHKSNIKMLKKLLKELIKQKYKTLLSNLTEKQLNGTKKVSFSLSCLKSSSNHSPIKVESSCPRWYLYFSLPKQEVKMKQRRLKTKIKKVKSLRFFLNMGMISDRIT